MERQLAITTEFILVAGSILLVFSAVTGFTVYSSVSYIKLFFACVMAAPSFMLVPYIISSKKGVAASDNSAE